jgi:hypothetical protein
MSLIAPILPVSHLEPSDDAAFACMSRESSFSPTSTEPSFWSTLLQRMNPRICLASLEGDLPLDVAVPIIRANLKSELKKKKAMQQLYDLTDQKHSEHRYVGERGRMGIQVEMLKQTGCHPTLPTNLKLSLTKSKHITNMIHCLAQTRNRFQVQHSEYSDTFVVTTRHPSHGSLDTQQSCYPH